MRRRDVAAADMGGTEMRYAAVATAPAMAASDAQCVTAAYAAKRSMTAYAATAAAMTTTTGERHICSTERNPERAETG